MEKNRSFKIITLAALLIAIISLSIGFAAYTETLTIGGIGKIVPGVWKVQFTKDGSNVGDLVSQKSGEATVISEATLTATTVSGFNATFTAPGDSITYNFEITNLGILPAKLTSFTMGTLSCIPAVGSNATEEEATAVCSDLIYTLKYSNGNEINLNDKLLNREIETTSEPSSKPVTLKLEWPSTSKAKVTDTIDVKIGVTSLVYTQD